MGLRYDSERKCKVGQESILGCRGGEDSTGDLVCAIRSDGQVVLMASSDRNSPGFSSCAADLQSSVVNGPSCQ